VQPSYVPAFSFAWLELISHRMLMPKLLLSKSHKVHTLTLKHSFPLSLSFAKLTWLAHVSALE